jgi:hypothetical protein
VRPQLVFALPMLMTLVACGQSSSKDSQPVNRESSGVVSVLLGEAPDSERFMLIERQVHACMTADGFDYTLQVPPSEVDPDSLERREAVGFGLVYTQDRGEEGMSTGVPAPELEGLTDADLERWTAAFSACHEDAMGRSEDQVRETLGSLGPELVAEVRALASLEHPGLTDGLQRWSACMTSEGYEFQDPIQMYVQLLEELDAAEQAGTTDTFAEAERSMAVADWHCWSSHVADAYNELIAELEGRAAALGVMSLYES